MHSRLSFLFQPTLGLKRWLAVIFAGLLLLALGGASFLTGVLAPWLTLTRLSPLVHTVLPMVLGIGLIYVGWQQLSRVLVHLLAPELGQQSLGSIVRERARQVVGRPVVVIGGGTGTVPIVQALQRSAAVIYPRVILSPTEGARLATILRNSFGLTSPQVILPTEDEVSLWAELENGTVLEGADVLRRDHHHAPVASLFVSRNLRRMQVWENLQAPLSADLLRAYAPEVNEEALALLKSAHMIVIAPGRLYVDILPLLSMPGIVDACNASAARVVLVANLMTEPGALSEDTVGEYLAAIREQTGLRVDYAVVNTGSVSSELLTKYLAEGSGQMRLRSDQTSAVSRLIIDDVAEPTTLVEGAIVVSGDLVSEAPQQIVLSLPTGQTVTRELPVARHDPDRLAGMLEALLPPHE